MPSPEELQIQIASTASDDPTLASLYSRLATQFKRRVERGESPDPAGDRAQAIAVLNQAIALQTQQRLNVDRAKTLNNWLSSTPISSICKRHREPISKH